MRTVKSLSLIFVLLFSLMLISGCEAEPTVPMTATLMEEMPSAADTETVPVGEQSPADLAEDPTVADPEPLPTEAADAAPPVAADEVMVVDEAGVSTVDQAALDGALSQLDPAELTEAEAADLLYMREEEKLARDVYLALYEQWGLAILQNIANSEQTHTEAVRTLIDRYGLADPAADSPAGAFANETLQALYAQLTAEGRQSLAAALRVGATIEDLDITDLQAAVGQTGKADIVLVYENLMKGSRNHLRAFVSTLQRQTGETYEPQYLDQAAYDDIISATVERGRGRGGPPANRPGGAG